MVFRDDHECRSCRGSGVIHVKTKEGVIDVICGCHVGRMVAKTVTPQRPVGSPRTATIKKRRVYG